MGNEILVSKELQAKSRCWASISHHVRHSPGLRGHTARHAPGIRGETLQSEALPIETLQSETLQGETLQDEPLQNEHVRVERLWMTRQGKSGSPWRAARIRLRLSGTI